MDICEYLDTRDYLEQFRGDETPSPVLCHFCHGIGDSPFYNGEDFGVYECRHCFGTGLEPDECTSCKGFGYIEKWTTKTKTPCAWCVTVAAISQRGTRMDMYEYLEQFRGDDDSNPVWIICDVCEGSGVYGWRMTADGIEESPCYTCEGRGGWGSNLSIDDIDEIPF